MLALRRHLAARDGRRAEKKGLVQLLAVRRPPFSSSFSSYSAWSPCAQEQSSPHFRRHRRRGFNVAHVSAAASFSSAAPSPRTVRQDHLGPSSSAETTSPGSGGGPGRGPGPLIDFSDTRAVYESTSSLQLVRSLVVLASCQIQPLVANAEAVLRITERIFGKRLVEAIVRRTFFAHFCAGEDEASIKPTIDRLRSLGVGSILDFAAEADDTATQPAPGPEQHHAAIHSELVDDDAAALDIVRKYSYEGEAACDAHVEVFLRCIESVHNVTPGGFTAVKMTALGPPALLKRMSSAIVEVRRLFDKFDTDSSDGYLTKDEFVAGYRRFFVDDKDAPLSSLPGAEGFSLDGLLHSLDPQGTGHIDYIEWSNKLRLEHLGQLTARCRQEGPLKQSVLTDWEMQAALNMGKRIDTLAHRAKELGVRLMVDAEQTYFQPAIDNTVYGLQERYNRPGSTADAAVRGSEGDVTVYNTYQLYLKDGLLRLRDDLNRAQRMDYLFGAKLVRGAYMVSERQRAADMGYPSPVQDTLEDTHAAYHAAVDLMLASIASGHGSEFMVASHNQRSVEYTLERMHHYGLPPNCGVHFGQLLGMSDHLTFLLGRNGYQAHKYVPYGEVGLVIPYLLRRAQENSALLGTARNEITMMRKELRRRIFGM